MTNYEKCFGTPKRAAKMVEMFATCAEQHCCYDCSFRENCVNCFNPEEFEEWLNQEADDD